MRAYELIEDTTFNIDLIWSEIESECSDIVSLYKQHKTFLYRGVKGKTDYFTGVPRNNRNPLHTDRHDHDFINEALTFMGIETNRSNSIATTPDIYQATDYGDGMSYIIFPTNGFKCLYATIGGVLLDDWIYIVSMFVHRFVRSILYDPSVKILPVEDVRIIRGIAENPAEFKKFKKDHEDKVKQYWNSVLNDKYKLHTDLKQALEKSPTRAEIMISNCKYHAINTKYSDLVLGKLGIGPITEAVGLVVPGVNTTVDVKPGETKRQAEKWGFDVDPNGVPIHSFWDSKNLIKKDND